MSKTSFIQFLNFGEDFLQKSFITSTTGMLISVIQFVNKRPFGRAQLFLAIPIQVNGLL